MEKLILWMPLVALVSSGCSTATPAQATTTPEKKYEQATQACWFKHGYDEAKENPGAPMVTTSATGTGNSAADVAFRACLQRAKADRDGALAAADAGQ